jgi:HAD superfamily hydrolase (TIGR01549 family)
LSIRDLHDFSVVSWDVDGTLYSISAMASMVAWLGIKRLIGSAMGGELPTGIAEEKLKARLSIERRWYGEAIRRVGTRKGVREALQAFRNAGLRQVAVSDYDCSYKLNALGLETEFDQIYVGEILGYLKPSTALFVSVTRQLCIEPERLLHIGDRRDRDGVAASAAGCSVLIIGEDFRSFPQLLRTVL